MRSSFMWCTCPCSSQRLYPQTPHKPAYFRYLTLMAFHVFLQEQVDATILEVGIGGTYDATNIVPKPLATGVTALGLDHTAILGDTIEAIARQKGGIYKVKNAEMNLLEDQANVSIERHPCTDCPSRTEGVVRSESAITRGRSHLVRSRGG